MGLTDILLSLDIVSILEIIIMYFHTLFMTPSSTYSGLLVKSLEGSIRNTNLSFIAVNGSKTKQGYYIINGHRFCSVRRGMKRTGLDVVVLSWIMSKQPSLRTSPCLQIHIITRYQNQQLD